MKIGIISDTHGHEMAWANACERFFNQEGGAEPDYSLFGIED